MPVVAAQASPQFAVLHQAGKVVERNPGTPAQIEAVNFVVLGDQAVGLPFQQLLASVPLALPAGETAGL